MNTKENETTHDVESEIDKREPVVKVVDLKKSFGKQDVLKNVSLELYNEENVVVLGKSGSGKSVLIKCITWVCSLLQYPQHVV